MDIIQGYIEISPILKTPEEVERIPPILLDVVEDGIILFDRKEFFRKILEKLERRLREPGSKRIKMEKDGTGF